MSKEKQYYSKAIELEWWKKRKQQLMNEYTTRRYSSMYPEEYFDAFKECDQKIEQLTK